MTRKIRLYLLALLLFCANSSSIHAQIAPTNINVPTNVDPGAIGRNALSEDMKKNNENKTKTDDDEILMPREINPKASAELEQHKFRLKNIVLSGNTRVKNNELKPYIKDFTDKEITINELTKLTNTITNIYRVKGYITSLAYIPNQEINDGILNINVIEGKVGNINIQGNKWTRSSYIKNKLLKKNRLKEDSVLNVSTLKKSLRDINEKSYLKGQVSLQKGEKQKTTDIIINISESIPLELSADWNNTGRKLVGIQKANVNLRNNNLTGFGDSLAGGVSFAKGTFGVNSNYSIPIGPFGTSVNAGYYFSNVNLGGEYKRYNINGKSHIFRTGLRQPIYKGDTLEVSTDMNFDFLHSDMTIQKETSLHKYDLRVLRFGLNTTKEGYTGRWINRSEISTGLPVFGGTSAGGHGIGSSKFVKLDSHLIRVQALPHNFRGIFKLSGQYSPNALLAPEQIQIGGMHTVRGYSESLVLGDVGYNVSLELLAPIPYLPDRKWLRLKNKVYLAGFYDQGLVHQIHKGRSINSSEFLQGAGVGLRCYLSKLLSANIDFGFPIGRKKFPEQDSFKVHFGLSSSIF